MATPTYELISSQVLSTSASSVTFSSIPATYRDLVLVITGTGAFGTNDNAMLRFNSDTGSNYSLVYMNGDGSTTSSFASTYNSLRLLAGNTFSPTFRTMHIAQIMDYSATDKHKTVLNRGNTANSSVSAMAGRWANTAAINTVLVGLVSGSYEAGTSFYLYGIAS